jgi:hypothetical protein
MIRIPALLLALALAFAAAPAHAQQSAAAAPLPALLQPSASTAGASALRTDPLDGPIRGGMIGMGLGCLLFGGLWAASGDSGNSVASDAVAGCGFGVIIGGAFGFTYVTIKQALNPRY